MIIRSLQNYVLEIYLDFLRFNIYNQHWIKGNEEQQCHNCVPLVDLHVFTSANVWSIYHLPGVSLAHWWIRQSSVSSWNLYSSASDSVIMFIIVWKSIGKCSYPTNIPGVMWHYGILIIHSFYNTLYNIKSISLYTNMANPQGNARWPWLSHLVQMFLCLWRGYVWINPS